MYATGRPITIQLSFPEMTEFTHLEIQYGQSLMPANFELPNLTKNSNVSLREQTDHFTIHLSPRIPMVDTLDIIVESTSSKVLQVKGVTGTNDRRFTNLWWDIDVRPCQPQELFYLLPRRQPIALLNKPNLVRDNQQITGYSRT